MVGYEAGVKRFTKLTSVKRPTSLDAQKLREEILERMRPHLEDELLMFCSVVLKLNILGIGRWEPKLPWLQVPCSQSDAMSGSISGLTQDGRAMRIDSTHTTKITTSIPFIFLHQQQLYYWFTLLAHLFREIRGDEHTSSY